MGTNLPNKLDTGSRAVRQMKETNAADGTDGHDRVTVLLEVAKTILASRQVEATIEIVLDKARELTGAESAGLLEPDPTDGLLRYTHASGQNAAMLRKRIALPLGHGVAGQAAGENAPAWTTDYLSDPRLVLTDDTREFVRRMGLRAALAVPLSLRGETRGALIVHYRGAHEFRQEEIEILSALASLSAVALENARVHEASHRRSQRLTVLNDLTRRMTTELNPEQVGNEILVAAQTLIPGAVGRFWERTGDDSLRLAASLGLRHQEGRGIILVRPGEGPMGVAATTGQPVTCDDLAQNEDFLNKAWAESEGLVSAVFLPLVYAEHFHGILAILTRTPHHFTDEELSLLMSFAAQAAIAIENARLYKESERRHSRPSTLVEVSQRLTRGLDLPTLLNSIAEAAATLFQGEAAFRLLEGEYLVRSGATPPARLTMARERVRVGESLSGVVAATGEPIISSDSAADARMLPDHRAAVRKDRTGALMCVPVRVESRILGTLHILRERGYQFGQDELSVALSLADQAAIAIENARLHEAALNAARHEAEASGQLEGISLAARELAHLLNNDLSVPVGLVELLQDDPYRASALGEMLGEAAQGLDAAIERIKRLQQVVRVEMKQTPVGPALDLERSATP